MENSIVTFRIGRGGRFNNAGHLSILGEGEVSEHIDTVHLFPDESTGLIYDAQGNDLCTIDEYNSGICSIDFDGQYDTVYSKKVSDLSERECRIILYDEYINDDIKDYIMKNSLYYEV